MSYEILTPGRIQRANPGRRIEWHVSARTRMKFRDLLGELLELEQLPWEPEVEERKRVIQDDIRALPGYPRQYHPDRDVIVPVTTSATR